MTARPAPRVSVVMPAYNHARFLVDAIESALGQTLTPLEVIVVDDGSRDDTPAVLARYGARIRVMAQNNRGVSVARNIGVESAKGELIAFLDADDRWLPAKLEQQVPALMADSSIGLAHCGVREVDASLVPMRDRTDGMSGWVAEDLLLMRPVMLAPSTFLVRREAFAEAGGFDERMRHGEDWDFCFRLALHRRIAFVPEVLAEYRRHGSNTSRDVSGMEAGMLYALQKAFASPGAGRYANLKRRAYGNLHLMLAGSYFTAGDWPRFLAHAGRALLLTPSAAGRFLSYPARRRRRNAASVFLL